MTYGRTVAKVLYTVGIELADWHEEAQDRALWRADAAFLVPTAKAKTNDPLITQTTTNQPSS